MADRDRPVACSKCGHWATQWSVSDTVHDYRVTCGYCRIFAGWKSEAQLAIQRTVVDVNLIPLPDPGPTLDAFFLGSR